MTFRAASFFSGVGGMDLGLQRAGIETVWACEQDPFAREVYATRFGRFPESADVTLVRPEDLPEVDLFQGGFPCQSVSSAGKREGAADGTRTGLIWTWFQLIAAKAPRWVLGENVPGLLSSGKGKDFEEIIRTFDGIGFDLAWRCLDARHFGVPQRRRRVFLLARLRAAPAPSGEVVAPWQVLDVPQGTARTSKPGGGWKNAGGCSRGVLWDVRLPDEWLPEAKRPSRLVDVLEREPVPARYFLSRKACDGILRRAERRGRKLPPALEAALRGAGVERVGPPAPEELADGSVQEVAGTLGGGAGQRGWCDDLDRATFVPAARCFTLFPKSEQGVDLRASEVDVAPALTATSEAAKTDRGLRVVEASGFYHTGGSRDPCFVEGGSPTLKLGTGTGGQGPAVAYPLDLRQVRESVATGAGTPATGVGNAGDPAFTLSVQGAVQAVAYHVHVAGSCARERHAFESDHARCLDTTGGFASQGGTVIAQPAPTPEPKVAHETGQGWWKEGDEAGTVRAEGENRPSRPSHVVYPAPGDVAPTVVASAGHHGRSSPRGDGADALVAFSCKDGGQDASEVSPTLRSMNFTGSHMNGGGQVAVAGVHPQVAGTLGSAHGTPRGNSSDAVIAFDTTQVTHPENRSRCEPGGPSPTLAARRHPPAVAGAAQVRRLTPLETERLQGLPDYWTLVPWGKRNPREPVECPMCRGRGEIPSYGCTDPTCSLCSSGKNVVCHGCEGARVVPLECASDSLRFAKVGNSVAVPVLEALGRRLVFADRIEKGEAS